MESSRAGNPHVTAFSVVTWGCDMAEVRNCLYLQSFLAIVSLVTGVTAELQDCEIFTTPLLQHGRLVDSGFRDQSIRIVINTFKCKAGSSSENRGE